MSERKSLVYRLLRWLGIIKPIEVNKKEMCEKAKSVCNKNCESCVWNVSQ